MTVVVSRCTTSALVHARGGGAGAISATRAGGVGEGNGDIGGVGESCGYDGRCRTTRGATDVGPGDGARACNVVDQSTTSTVTNISAPTTTSATWLSRIGLGGRGRKLVDIALRYLGTNNRVLTISIWRPLSRKIARENSRSVMYVSFDTRYVSSDVDLSSNSSSKIGRSA